MDCLSFELENIWNAIKFSESILLDYERFQNLEYTLEALS